MNLPNDYSRCNGNKCSISLKSRCKRWIENNKKDDKKIISISDFTPIKKQGGNWNCKYKIDKQ